MSAQEQQQHHYHFSIAMSCTGCSGAIERTLAKVPNLSSYTVSLEDQTADVYTMNNDGASYEDVLAKIKKTGKEVKGAERDGVAVPF